MNPEPKTLIWDWNRGEIIDPISAEVVDRIYVNDIPFTNDDDKHNLNIEIVTLDNELHPLYLPYSLYIVLEKIMNIFVNLKQIYSIPYPIYLFENTIRYYLKKIRKTKEIKKILGKKIIAGLIYIALEENKVPIDMYSLCRTLEIDYSELRSAIIRIKKALGKNTTSFEDKTLRNITMYVQKLGLDPKIEADAIELYNKIRFVNRFTPRIVALAMLYISILKNKRSVKPLTTVVKIDKLKNIVKYICSNNNVCGEI
ncbi:MAG: hypothetical protein QXE70_10265 [Ignisphaera sp.]